MGGGVSGGTRTQLAGTYLAEQTHYQPPKYTLVSVSSALGPDGCPRHLPSSSVGAPSTRLRQGGPAPVTVIPALADMEPLLQDNERRAKERCEENEEQSGAEETLVEADGHSRRKTRDREAPTEAFVRLSCCQRPWVATRTDQELYAYLAQRSNDSNMAQLAESPSPKAETPSRSVVKYKHDHHTELFDNVLRQDQSRPQSVSSRRAVFWSSLPSSPKSPNPPRRHTDLPKSREVTNRLYGDYLRRKERAEARMLLAGVPWDQSKMDEMSSCTTPSTSASSRFLELIEDLSVKDIVPCPEDPVEAFLSRRKPKRDEGQKPDLLRRTSTLHDKERSKRDRTPKVLT